MVPAAGGWPMALLAIWSKSTRNGPITQAAIGFILPLVALVSGAGPDASCQDRCQTEGDECQEKASEKAQQRVACCRPAGRSHSFVFTVKSDSADCEKDTHCDTYRRRSY
jgi:hypothetical protein